MALIQKINPLGLDSEIDDFQTFIYPAVGFVDWECYPRIYQNPNSRKMLPEYYKGNGEYIEVLYDDKYKVTSFFLANEKRKLLEGGDIVEMIVSLIVQADIEKLFPAITHRADEELNNLFLNQSSQYVGNRNFKLIDIENGVENVYREFDTSRLKLEDMSNQYIVRFNYRVRFTPEC